MLPTLIDSGAILASCYAITKCCDAFELGADYLGRNLSAGAKGGIVNALGSSMPELLVTLAFVLSGKPELILAGISLTAGSAIFNAVLIPAVSILFAKDKQGNKSAGFKLDRRYLLRDGFYLLLVEGVLIWILGQPAFTPTMMVALLVMYAAYVVHVMYDSKKSGTQSEAYDGPLTKSWQGWGWLIVAMAGLGFACHLLAGSIENIAVVHHWSVYIVAVTLGAAATSLPDTILSVKSAKNGEGDDAVSNAIGSNIFDVTGALAIPLLIASAVMLFNGQVPTFPIEQSAGLTGLRCFVWGSSALVVGILTAYANCVTKKVSGLLGLIYIAWIGYLIMF